VFAVINKGDCYFQILIRDHEKGLEIGNMRKLRKNKDDRLKKKDTAIKRNILRMKTTDSDLTNISNEQLLSDEQYTAGIALRKKEILKQDDELSSDRAKTERERAINEIEGKYYR
jgi:hypothetical protein